MARARLIASSLGTSEKFSALGEVAGELCDFAQALYPLLIVNSDDHGRMEGSPYTVKVRIFPISAHGEGDFERALSALDHVGLISRYRAPSGKQLIEIVGFDDHQTGLNRRTTSAFPDSNGKFQNKSQELPVEQNRTEQNGTELNALERRSQADALERRSQADFDPRGLPVFADAADDEILPADETTEVDPRDLVTLWNNARVFGPPGAMPGTRVPPKVQRVTQGLMKKIRTRLKLFPKVEEWSVLFDWINRQAWCRGDGDGRHADWTASLQWIVGSDEVMSKHMDSALNERDTAVPAEPEAIEEETSWDLIRTAVAGCVDKRAYESWFAPTRLVREEGHAMVIGGPSLCLDWITEHYQDVLNYAVQKHGLDHYTITFEPDDDRTPEEPPSPAEADA